MAAGTSTMAGTAMIATSLFSAGAQMIAGRQEEKAYEYNAAQYMAYGEQQASVFEKQKQIQMIQDQKNKQRMIGKQIAAVASSGVEMTGSPLAVMNASLAEMEFDMAISRYNYDIKAWNAREEARQSAEQSRFKGKQAYRTGLLKGAGTALRGMYAATAGKGADDPLGANKQITVSNPYGPGTVKGYRV